MPNPRIVPRNFHDEATLATEFAPVDGYSIDNTKDRQRSRVWRSTDGTDQYVSGTYADGLSRTVDHFSMFLHRCHGGQFRLRLYSDNNWTTQVHDSTLVDIMPPSDGLDWGIDPYGDGTTDPYFTDAPFWLWLDEPIEHLSFRYYFSSNVSTYDAAYWQVARFFLGLSYEFPYSVLYDNALGFVDQTERNRSRGGSLRTNVGPNWREFTADIKRLPEADRAGWIDLKRRLGTGRDFVFSLFPEDGTRKERDHMMNCVFKTLDPMVRWLPGWLSSRIQIEEV